MSLQVSPPIAPMLAKSASEIPAGDGWRYEPKWDGIRAIAFRDGADVELRSRDDRPLGRYFPEILEACASIGADRWVADGELILAGPEGLAFDQLLQRIHPAASRVAMLAEEWPATFVLFDLLETGEQDLRAETTDERRAALEALARSAGVSTAVEELSALPPGPIVLITPRTDDPELARRWFSDEVGIGQDGLIARRAETPYREGERVMVKIKHRRSIDVVVAGYRLGKRGDGVGSLLLGLYDGDALHYVGHTSSFKAPERRALLERLAPYEGDSGFGEGRIPGGPSRWTGSRDLSWVALRPELVCEVTIDRMQGPRIRHAATFVRWREDRDPRSCTFEQLSRER